MASQDGLMSVVCGYEEYLQLIVAGMIFLFILTLFSLYFGTPGTAAYTIAIFDAGLVLAFGALSAILLWYCLQNKPTDEQTP